MPIESLPVDRYTLLEYAEIPIGFQVDARIEIDRVEPGPQGLTFREVPVDPPYMVDYDQEEKPVDWLNHFKMDHWRLFRVWSGGVAAGGAVVALRSPEVHMLDGRDDLALIWDIRVRPQYRGQGFGTRLFQAAAGWAVSQGCRQLKIETQNTNVRACRFYAARGCVLGELNFFKYVTSRSYANDVMLCWYLDLGKRQDESVS